METTKTLIEQAKTLLYEAENNPTIQEKWKVGMKVAVEYIIDNIYNRLFKEWVYINSDDSNNKFDVDVCYDINDTLDKQIKALEDYFNTFKID